MENDKITDISVYIAALQTTFKPAWDARHTTHWFTTDEVYQSIKKLDPAANISKEDIFKAMTDAGFKFQNRPRASGCDFRWMLELKNSK